MRISGQSISPYLGVKAYACLRACSRQLCYYYSPNTQPNLWKSFRKEVLDIIRNPDGPLFAKTTCAITSAKFLQRFYTYRPGEVEDYAVNIMRNMCFANRPEHLKWFVETYGLRPELDDLRMVVGNHYWGVAGVLLGCVNTVPVLLLELLYNDARARDDLEVLRFLFDRNGLLSAAAFTEWEQLLMFIVNRQYLDEAHVREARSIMASRVRSQPDLLNLMMECTRPAHLYDEYSGDYEYVVDSRGALRALLWVIKNHNLPGKVFPLAELSKSGAQTLTPRRQEALKIAKYVREASVFDTESRMLGEQILKIIEWVL